MSDRVFIVTGANSGIGYFTAREIARTGGHVVMACRNLEKANAARDAIVAETRNERVAVMQVDVGDLASLRKFADNFKKKYERLDVLVNNAGVSLPTRELTADGFERMFAINHVGYHVGACLLAEVLVRTPGARVVNVASMGHRLGWLDFDNLQGEKWFNSVVQYSTTKLENVLFSALLAARLQGRVTSNSLHPGVIRSGFAQDEPGWFGTVVKLSGPFLISSEKGARTSIHLALSPDVAGITGKYFVNRKQATPSHAARNMANAERLWAYTVDRTGVDLPSTL